MRYYLDTSVLVPLFVTEQRSAIMNRWLAGAGGNWVVSGLAIAEFGSAISRLVRMGQHTDKVAAELLDDFDRWAASRGAPTDNTPRDFARAAQMVRRAEHKLLAPDAIHLATCDRLGLTMVTFDDTTAEVAGFLAIGCVVPA